jgi:hypothetical protein
MMRALLLAAAAGACSGAAASPKPFVGGYAMLNGEDGLRKLSLLASSASTLPITRLFLGFFSPSMVYVAGSGNISATGLALSSAPDGGYSVLKAAIGTLSASGIDVLLSMGGWDYNCYPYAYTRYSVAGYGTR